MKNAHSSLDLDAYWRAYLEKKETRTTQVEISKKYGLNQSTLSRITRLVLFYGEDIVRKLCVEGTTTVDGVIFVTLSSLHAYREISTLNLKNKPIFGRGDRDKLRKKIEEENKKEENTIDVVVVPNKITSNQSLFLAIETLKKNNDLNTLKKVYDNIKEHFTTLI